MKLSNYIKDKLFEITLEILTIIILILLELVFKSPKQLIYSSVFIVILTYIIIFTTEYNRKKSFYKILENNIKNLDKAYLVLETIKEPTFYEGKLIYNILYEINKSYIENIDHYYRQTKDFKDYIEMWIHEVKIPVSCLTLITHNNKNKFSKNAIHQIKKIDDYLEQVLYYVRSENASKDYLINKINLKKCINSIAIRNKDLCLESKVDLIVKNVDCEIYTDSKWLEFILNQIINNSIKYKDNKKSSFIKIYTQETDTSTTIIIEDNGIGIEKSDLNKVFEKSFTGINGRKNYKSTGMGLFIAKKLCNQLGHKITIESELNKYTKVSIKVSKNNFYDTIK